MLYKRLRGKMGCWPGEFCKKIAICFLEKEIPIFHQGRPQGHPGGKSGFPADKKQSGSFAKVYRRNSLAKQSFAFLLPQQTCREMDFWLEQGKCVV